jgi:hypothetical protein
MCSPPSGCLQCLGPLKALHVERTINRLSFTDNQPIAYFTLQLQSPSSFLVTTCFHMLDDSYFEKNIISMPQSFSFYTSYNVVTCLFTICYILSVSDTQMYISLTILLKIFLVLSDFEFHFLPSMKVN